MLADRRDFPCTVMDVSESGLALNGPQQGAVGESVVIYTDQLGRIQGVIVRLFEGGFAVNLNMTGIAARRFADRLYGLETPRTLSRLIRRR